MTWGTGQAIPRPIGTAGDDGQEIFRWRVMLRKGKFQLPYTPMDKNIEGLREKAREGGGASHVASRPQLNRTASHFRGK